MTKDTKKDDIPLDETGEEVGTNTDDATVDVKLLQKKLTEQEEITRRAQSDYLRTKLEFDEYVKRSDAAKLGFELDGLMKALGKVLPFVNQLKTTLDNLPEDLNGHARAE
jgi:molecular chaperone GrpE (heat shock protein)